MYEMIVMKEEASVGGVHEMIAMNEEASVGEGTQIMLVVF